MATPMKTHITVITICASAFFACVRTLPADAIDDAPVPEVSDTEPAEADDSTDTEADPVPDFPDAEWGWEPEPDMPDECQWGLACISADGACSVSPASCPDGAVSSPVGCIEAATGMCAEVHDGPCQDGWFAACGNM